MASEKIIQIKGGSYEEVKGALQQWIAMYADQLSDDSQFRLYKNGDENHIIKPDSRIDNERFFFMVNYIGYPEGIAHKLEVEGFTKGETKSQFGGQELLVYNSKTDTEYDNVFVVTKDNQHFKIDFGGKTEAVQCDKSFTSLSLSQIKKPEILKVVRYKMWDRPEEVSYDEVSKAFKIVALIFLLAHLLNLLVYYFTNNSKNFELGLLMLCMLNSFWFYSEFEMFHFSSFYYKTLMIAIGLIGYGFLLINYFDYHVKEFFLLFFLPLIFLVFQWPTRQLFKKILQREPKVVDYGSINDKFGDWIYSAVLLSGLIGIPVFIMLNFY